MTSRGRARVAAWVAGGLVMGSLAACGPDARDAGPDTLRWYVEDAGSLAALARSCSDASQGDYRIELVEAPSAPLERRTDLLRRLRTGDHLDLIGLDTALVGELAESGLLADVPGSTGEALTDGRTDASVEAVTVDGKVVAAPWFYEPQVLFHRGTAAERAGLDMTMAVTWNQLSAGASRIGGTVQVAGPTSDWVRALLAGAADALVLSGDDLLAALDGSPGEAAAGVVRTYAASGVGPGASLDAATTFAAPGGTFLVGPVSLMRSPQLAPVMAELRVAPYPLTSASATTSRAPLSGTSLAVAASTSEPDIAFDAISCLTAEPAQTQLVATTGHLPTLAQTLASTDVAEVFDDLPLVTEALDTGVPEPRSADAHLIGAAVDAVWTPVSAVGTSTPGASAEEARRLLDGGLA